MLRFGIVQIIDINCLDTEIMQTPGDHLLQIARCDAVLVVCAKVVWMGQSILNEIGVNPFTGIGWQFTVKGNKPAFGRDHDLIAPDRTRRECFYQPCANGTFTALEAIIDGAVNYIAAERYCFGHCFLVGTIRHVLRMAQVGSKPNRRHPQVARRLAIVCTPRFGLCLDKPLRSVWCSVHFTSLCYSMPTTIAPTKSAMIITVSATTPVAGQICGSRIMS